MIEQFSPRLGELAELGGAAPELVLRFSVDAARDDAWRAATVVSVTPSSVLDVTTDILDRKATFLGRLVADPIEPFAAVVRRIEKEESRDVGAVITALDGMAVP